MNTKRKSIGTGAALTRTHGDGSVGGSANDLSPSAVPTRKRGLLYAEPRQVLDGMVTRRLGAFDAETEGSGEARTLYVPFHTTTCPASALRICFESGLLKVKLANMTPEAEDYLYLTTLARAEPKN